MQHSHGFPNSLGSPLPERFLSRLAGFADLFTRPTWSNVLAPLAGVVLAPGRRTVTAALRILGRDRDRGFCTFHRILNRAEWSSRAVAGRLPILLVKAFAPSGAPVVIGIDDTIERRWGAKISARGIYRDPVRSSKGHFVKASGLRWLSAMLLVRAPWAGRIMALPFLTLLAPSKRFYASKSRAPKTERPRHCSIGPARLPCKSIAGSPIAPSCWSPTARSRQSNFSPPSAPMSASSPACGSTQICSASRRKSAKAAAGRQPKASA
jgi:hypothetical protein